MNLTIFNSWQSNSPFNSKAIRTALREASSKAESKIAGLHLNTDEATSNHVGSLHIPNAILRNIANAHVFVVDLSTVGVTTDGEKKLQNPNVLIELGYAISQLGWDRVILLFNTAYGDFSDLPFDIEKRSCVDFKVMSDDDKNGVARLRDDLTRRLVEIIEANPDKPSLKTVVLDKDRTGDIQTIKRILIWMPITEMDAFNKGGSVRIKDSLIRSAKQLDEITRSLGFYVSDERLRKRIYALDNKWNDLVVVLKKRYTQQGDHYINKSFARGKKKPEYDIVYLLEEIEKTFSSFLKYVRNEYPEIDL